MSASVYAAAMGYLGDNGKKRGGKGAMTKKGNRKGKEKENKKEKQKRVEILLKKISSSRKIK